MKYVTLFVFTALFIAALAAAAVLANVIMAMAPHDTLYVSGTPYVVYVLQFDDSVVHPTASEIYAWLLAVPIFAFTSGIMLVQTMHLKATHLY